MTRAVARQLAVQGFAVVPGWFEAAPLSAEFDATMAAAFVDADHLNAGAIGNRFRYVPMMGASTPASLDLLARLATLAADLTEAEVLPTRAKATTYVGSARWHRDSDLPVRSFGFACYLEPLAADTGALRVLPGSHHLDFGDAVAIHLSEGAELVGVAVPTKPGDVIVFDEHLFHSSNGGTAARRQWRVDFVVDDGASDDVLRAYYGRQYSVGWDGGYDIDRYPSYGNQWRTMSSTWNRRLDQVGAYAAAAAEESAVRQSRSVGPSVSSNSPSIDRHDR